MCTCDGKGEQGWEASGRRQTKQVANSSKDGREGRGRSTEAKVCVCVHVCVCVRARGVGVGLGRAGGRGGRADLGLTAHLLLQRVTPQLHHLQPVQQRRRDVGGAIGGGNKQGRGQVKGLQGEDWAGGGGKAAWAPQGLPGRGAGCPAGKTPSGCSIGGVIGLTKPR